MLFSHLQSWVSGILTSGCSLSIPPVTWWLQVSPTTENNHMVKLKTCIKNQQMWLQKISPRLCFRVSRASSVANKVFGKRMKILDLRKCSGRKTKWWKTKNIMLKSKRLLIICVWLTCPVCTPLACTPDVWPVWPLRQTVFPASLATCPDTGICT